MAIGASYFGNRILRHARGDMEDLVSRGFTGVLHTMSENDLNYYPEQLGRLVDVSHEVGLEVQIGPWGVGHAFGGEAESLFTATHPELCQVFDDGRPVGAACLNRESFRDFVKGWADAAIAAGADRIFWDEPHWAHPARFGLHEDRWACRCEVCRARFRDEHGGDMPLELTDEVVAFREGCLVGFVRELVAHVAARGARSTVCLLPLVEGSLGLRDWNAIASADGLDTIATDPYWGVFDRPAADFVGRFADRVRGLADTHGLTAQIWIQGFGLGPEDVEDIHAAVRAARAADVDDIWTWGYDACGHMDHLGTRDPQTVWQALTDALTEGGTA